MVQRQETSRKLKIEFEIEQKKMEDKIRLILQKESSIPNRVEIKREKEETSQEKTLYPLIGEASSVKQESLEYDEILDKFEKSETEEYQLEQDNFNDDKD